MRERTVALAAAVTLASMAGCASLPTSGTVHAGRALRQTQGENSVGLILPGRPTAGMAPAQIVRGFLGDQSTPEGADVARAYLSPGAQSRWHPGSTVTVYDDRSERLVSQAGGRWVLFTRRVAVVDPSGHWAPRPGPLALRFRLVRIAGQWRIAEPPRHQVIASGEVSASYTEFHLGFLNARGDREVDVPAVLPDQQPGLANSLVDALLAGPPRRLAGAVTTAASRGTRLIGNVTVTGHTAAVNLTEAARALPASRLRRFAEQVLVTLRQVPDVARVRLQADRADLLTVDSAADLQPPGRAASLTLVRPGGTVEVARAGVSVDDRSVAPPRWEPLLGPRWPAVTAVAPTGGATIAAVAAGRGRSRLLTGAPDGRPRVLVRARQLSLQPNDSGQALAIVDDRRLALIRPARLQTVALPQRLRGQVVTAAALAPDGTQVAVVTRSPSGGRLLMGALSDGQVVGAQPVVGIRGPVTVGWSDDDTLVTIARAGGRPALVTTDPLAFDVRHSSLPAGRTPSALCAAPLDPPVVVVDGTAFRVSGGGWDRIGPAANCAYSP